MIGNWLHSLAHLFSLNTGWPEAWWDDEKLMVGFRCKCGRLSSVSDTGKRWKPPKAASAFQEWRQAGVVPH